MNSSSKKHHGGPKGHHGEQRHGSKGHKDQKNHKVQKGQMGQKDQKGQKPHKQNDVKTVKKNSHEKRDHKTQSQSKKRQQCIKILNIFLDLLSAILDLFICDCFSRMKSAPAKATKPEMKVKEKPSSKAPVESMTLVPRLETPVIYDDEYYLDLYKKQMYSKPVRSVEEALALAPVRVKPVVTTVVKPIVPQIEDEEEDEEDEEETEEQEEEEEEEEEEEQDEEEEEDLEEDHEDVLEDVLEDAEEEDDEEREEEDDEE